MRALVAGAGLMFLSSWVAPSIATADPREIALGARVDAAVEMQARFRGARPAFRPGGGFRPGFRPGRPGFRPGAGLGPGRPGIARPPGRLPAWGPPGTRPPNRPVVGRPLPPFGPPGARPPNWRPIVGRPLPPVWRPWRPGLAFVVVAGAVTAANAARLRWCHVHEYATPEMVFHSDVRCHRHEDWDHPSIRYVFVP